MAGRKQRRRQRGLFINTNLLVLLLVVCCFVTLAVTFLHGSVIHNLSSTSSLLISSASSSRNSLAGLECDRFGGPSAKAAREMVYWEDVEADAKVTSPFYSPHKYMSFEPDGGGWNNIRMSMETVLGMAHAMGRTLVLPPEQRMYLLGSSRNFRKEFSFQDFFPMEEIAAHHVGLNIITMQEFLETVAMQGKLRDADGNVSFPPHNRTQWDGMSREIKQELNPWLRQVTVMPEWNPNKCLAAFASSTDPKDEEELEALGRLLQTEKKLPTFEDFVGKPFPVNASAKDRLMENLAGRSQLCIYNSSLQKAPLLHFHGSRQLGGRLLVHFYAFLFFQDWRQDLWMKRFVRDHVRYVDEIQCAAARIVEAVRQRSREHNNDGIFDAFHVRRGDFQYKVTRVEAKDIYNISSEIIPEGSTVYIGTDERNKTFFDPLKQHWDVVFLDDFMHLVEGLNPSYFGMLDQLVTTRSRYFFGCWFSTFTGYINRLRGYHSDNDKLPGYEEGVIESYYYALPEHKMKMRTFYPVKQAFHAREFPRSWMNIDYGRDEYDAMNQ